MEKNNQEYYKPLPNGLVIRNSAIHGQGLFTTISLKKGTVLGLSHVACEWAEDGYLRTALGGFINHSATPTLEKLENDHGNLWIQTIDDIPPETELTLHYTFYDPTVEVTQP